MALLMWFGDVVMANLILFTYQNMWTETVFVNYTHIHPQ